MSAAGGIAGKALATGAKVGSSGVTAAQANAAVNAAKPASTLSRMLGTQTAKRVGYLAGG